MASSRFRKSGRDKLLVSVHLDFQRVVDLDEFRVAFDKRLLLQFGTLCETLETAVELGDVRRAWAFADGFLPFIDVVGWFRLVLEGFFFLLYVEIEVCPEG